MDSVELPCGSDALRRPVAGLADQLADQADRARAAVCALAHLTQTHEPLDPADIDVVLGHLADTVATLPQVAQQLGQALERSQRTHQLTMDDITDGTDPVVAIATAVGHLATVRAPAHLAYECLNGARNQAAHIGAVRLEPDTPMIYPEGASGADAGPVDLIRLPEEWPDQALLTLEEFCELTRTPERTVRAWRRRGVGPAWGRFPGTRRLYTTVAETHRFLNGTLAPAPRTRSTAPGTAR